MLLFILFLLFFSYVPLSYWWLYGDQEREWHKTKPEIPAFGFQRAVVTGSLALTQPELPAIPWRRVRLVSTIYCIDCTCSCSICTSGAHCYNAAKGCSC